MLGGIFIVLRDVQLANADGIDVRVSGSTTLSSLLQLAKQPIISLPYFLRLVAEPKFSILVMLVP